MIAAAAVHGLWKNVERSNPLNFPGIASAISDLAKRFPLTSKFPHSHLFVRFLFFFSIIYS